MRIRYQALMIVFCVILVTAGVLLAGCSYLPGSPAVQTTQTTPVVTTQPTPTVITPATTPSVVSTIPTTATTTVPVVDGAFLSAYSDSRAKILGILTNINTEIVKDGNQNASLPDYTALGSYGRQLGVAIGAESERMLKFRQFEDPANEALRDQYVSYLSALLPFAGNIEAGGGVAQKRQYSVASQYFANAQNDLGVVRTVPIPEQRTVINEIRTNLGPLHDILVSQASGSGL